LGEIPLVKSISDSGDSGLPAVMDEDSIVGKIFMDIAGRVAQQLSILNEASFQKA